MPTSKTFNWKTPRAITNAVVVVMVIDLVGSLFGIGIFFALGNTAVSADAISKLDMFGIVALSIYGLFSLAGLLGFPVTMFWILRVSRNAHVLKGSSLESAPWFAALWWYVIPFMWFFKPLEAMTEIWDVSAGEPGRRSPQRSLLWFWWSAILLGNLIVFIDVLFNIKIEFVRFLELTIYLIQSSTFLIIAHRICDMQIQKEIALTFSDAPPRPTGILEQLNV